VKMVDSTSVAGSDAPWEDQGGVSCSKSKEPDDSSDLDNDNHTFSALSLYPTDSEFLPPPIPRNQSPLINEKRVKRGYRDIMSPKVCGIMFEGEPAWLWAIRLSDFSSILITQSNALTLQQNHFATWEKVKAKLTVIDDSEVGLKTTAHFWLVSGSWDFFSIKHPWVVARDKSRDATKLCDVVIWLQPSVRRKPSSKGSDGCRWISLAHSQVGGMTTVRGMFGVVGDLPTLKVILDPISRTIDHLLKHSVRPKPCHPEELVVPHLLVTDRLSVHRMDQPVLYPSHFSRSGWGYRALTPEELAHAFDLPPYLSWDARFRATLVPLHLLRVILDQVLDSLNLAIQPHPAQRPRLLLSSDSALLAFKSVDQEFLPGLNRWLPGSWSDAPIAERAVKADNAAVDFSPWHRRISLVLPCNSLTLIRLEEFALRWWRRRTARSFRLYLSTTYGDKWQSLSVNSGPSPARGKRALCGRGVIQPQAKRACRQLDNSSRGGGAVVPLDTDTSELSKDLQAGRAVLSQILQSSWWEWSHGSSLCFWRWNGVEQIRAARDGMKIFVQSTLPQGRRLKQIKLAPAIRTLVADKVDGMLKRGYLDTGHVSNSLHYFAVPKGDSDIRVVFDGTSSGLNETLWAPNFYLPSARAASLTLSFSTWMGDMDFGEMFHNFFMDPQIRKCAGIKIKPIASKLMHLPFSPTMSGSSSLQESPKPEFLRWTRLFMGMKPSPYNAIRHYYWGEEFARGNPALSSNPMSFNRIILNLPGSKDYDPGLPKVMKWNDKANNLAGDVVTFVDDVRFTGYSKANCQAVRRQFASRIQFLGMQDAPRKFRPPSQDQAGAWTGTIFRISSVSISKSVSAAKWEKGRTIIAHLATMCESESGRPRLNRKLLERDTGFLNHLAMTYEIFNPFLKGFYLTLNSWRSRRDSDDWKVPDNRWKQWLMNQHLQGKLTEDELDEALGTSDINDQPPEEVIASTRFAGDVSSLLQLFTSNDNPPAVNLRSKNIVTVIYGFGDASGSGLGSTFTCGTGFTFRIGVWGSLDKPESSNWKEFTNVVEALEDEAAEGNLHNAEVFMFTDNSTVESCAKRGSSSSPKLLDLILRLNVLTTRLGVQIHIFHVAGTRMIAQGTDGVSRGCLAQGVMAGEAMSAHVPIFLSAFDRSNTSNLLEWMKGWCGRESILLNEMGWFTTGHDIDCWVHFEDGFDRPSLTEGRTYIWAPPPIAAEVALAELRKARIKRQTSAHIVVIPRLCTGLWLRQLYKAADIVFEVPVGSSIWSIEMHEPLLIGILFPFIRSKPWQLRNTPKMFAVGRELRSLLQDSSLDSRDFLRKFWVSCVRLKSLPENVVRQMLYFE
jgi:hypothetical protein